MGMRGVIWWLGAFVFAAMAGILTFGLLSAQSPNAKGGGAKGDTQQVVVARTDIAFRRSIGDTEVVLKELPIDLVPDGAATSIDQVIGKMSEENIAVNEVVVAKKLVTPDIVTKLVALSVPKGKVVTVVPTESALISNRLVRPGDRIDLLATIAMEIARDNGSGALPATINMLKNLEVHAIILPTTADQKATEGSTTTEEGGVFHTLNEEGQSILVAVDPQDAQMIRYVLDVKGHVDLALRATGDDSDSDTKAVDQWFFAEKFGIDLVREGQLNLSSPYPGGQ